MTREIKFRAWDKNDKKIVQIGEIDWENNWLRIIPDNKKTIRRKRWLTTQILMQFTGLKDSKGKEIYEGDIIAISTRKCKHEITTENWEIKWYEGHGGFSAWSCDGTLTTMDGYRIRPCEVIGNIYENPELLENTK